MRRFSFAWLSVGMILGCDSQPAPLSQPPPSPSAGVAQRTVSLAEARQGFKTKLLKQESDQEPTPVPPAEILRVVRYKSSAGELAAYLTPDPGDGKKHPAILWINGGFGNGLGSSSWMPASPDNDQSSSAFRKAGIVLMKPALRGGQDGMGIKECLFGEVDDVLAAADYLAKQDFVDPQRIYLGGHSTGGTLVLLVAEMSDRFRAVFSFGPVEDVAKYDPDDLPFDLSNPKEVELRSPKRWLASIKSPVYVFEGEEGNASSLLNLSNAMSNPFTHYYLVKGKDHFSILAPITNLLARKVVSDTGPSINITFSQEELDQAR